MRLSSHKNIPMLFVLMSIVHGCCDVVECLELFFIVFKIFGKM